MVIGPNFNKPKFGIKERDKGSFFTLSKTSIKNIKKNNKIETITFDLTQLPDDIIDIIPDKEFKDLFKKYQKNKK